MRARSSTSVVPFWSAERCTSPRPSRFDRLRSFSFAGSSRGDHLLLIGILWAAFEIIHRPVIPGRGNQTGFVQVGKNCLQPQDRNEIVAVLPKIFGRSLLAVDQDDRVADLHAELFEDVGVL